MLSLSQFQIKTQHHFISPAFSLVLPLPGNYVLAGRNGAGKSLLLAALANNGTPMAGVRECKASIAQVSIEMQQQLIDEEKKKDSADILDVIPSPTKVSELLERSTARNEHALQHTHYSHNPIFHELVRVLRIKHLLDADFLSLSTGETRKVIIVLAWLSGASLILLDEPFEGLDAKAKQDFSQFLSSQQHASLIITANKLDDIPDRLHANLLVMKNLSVAWQSDQTLNAEEIRHELGTWFALESEDIMLPAPLSEHQHSVPQTLIKLNAGRVSYGERVIFEGVNFQLNKQEHWQISGHNGSGKTCLLQMFTGDNPHCYTNDLTMFGIQRGSGESIWDIKKHIGIMSNALHLQYKVNTSLENVILSGFYDSIGLYTKPTNAEREKAAQWLAVLGLSMYAGSPFQSLSFGDQRLALIARAMVKHPALLILDEPCNGLDEFNRVKTLKLIEKIVAQGQSTVLYVTHSQYETIAGIQHHLTMEDYHPA